MTYKIGITTLNDQTHCNNLNNFIKRDKELYKELEPEYDKVYHITISDDSISELVNLDLQRIFEILKDRLAFITIYTAGIVSKKNTTLHLIVSNNITTNNYKSIIKSVI